MADEEKTEETKGSATFLDLITGKIGKITALLMTVASIVAVSANLMSGIGTIRSSFTDFFGGGAKSSRDCVVAKLTASALEVTFANRRNMNLHLMVKNNCKESVFAFIYFKPLKGRVIIKSAYSCEQIESGCWETRKIEPGPAIDWQLSLPDLEPLKLPFGEPVPLEINWILYSEDKKILDSSKTKITLRD